MGDRFEMDQGPKGKRKKGLFFWRTIIIPFSTLQFWVSFLLVLLILSGVFAVFYFQFLSPRAHADRMISKADKLFDEAIVLGIKELAFSDFQSVQESLFKARNSFDDRKYEESVVFAEETMTTLEGAMDRLRSDEYFRKERAASVTFLKGSVDVKKAGSLDWSPAKKPMLLSKGDRIRTRSGARCIVQFDDGSQLTIKSNSLVHIDELSEDIRTRTKSSAIKLLVSDVEANILRPTAKGSRFMIETPGSVAQIKKARMSVRVGKDRRTQYKMLAGDVVVSAGGKQIRITESDVISFTGGGKLLSRSRLLAAPGLKEPSNLSWLVSRKAGIPVTFSWKKVSRASRYHLTVGMDRYFTNVIYDNGRIGQTSTTVKELGAGLYYWKVSSLDRRGRESLFSPFRVLKVIRDQKPPLLEMAAPIVLSGPEGSRVYISGAVEPGSDLSLNDRKIALSTDGSFRTFLSIRPDDNTLKIRASDLAGNVLAQTRALK